MPTTLLIVAAVAILIILLATASYKVCPADRVMVITGPGGRRFVSGGSAFIIPFIMRVDWLSLGAVQSLLRTDTPIPTKDAILIDVNAVANFQIASETMTVDENGKQVKALENAAKNYLNQSKERMEKDVTQVLLGKLREVIGRTELKTLMENRETFATTVAESARVDMERLGLQLTTFNIQDFTDRQNVIANMGAEMAAEIQPECEARVHQRGTGRGRPSEPARPETSRTPIHLRQGAGRGRRGEGHHRRRTVQDSQGQGAGG